MATATKIRSTTFEMTDLEVVAFTEVDAPRELVWKAHTEPEHLQKWMGVPAGWDMTVAEMDVRPGGKWRWKWEGPDDETLEMHGEYRDVLPPSKLVNTENWGEPYPETVNTLTLTEELGRTTIRSAVRYPTSEARDAATETGMLDGWAQGNEKLIHYLREVQGTQQ